MPKFLASCHYSEEKISRHLEKNIGYWPVHGSKFATGRILKKPVEVVKGGFQLVELQSLPNPDAKIVPSDEVVDFVNSCPVQFECQDMTIPEDKIYKSLLIDGSTLPITLTIQVDLINQPENSCQLAYLTGQFHYTKQDIQCLIMFSVVTTLPFSTLIFNSLTISVRHICAAIFSTVPTNEFFFLIYFKKLKDGNGRIKFQEHHVYNRF